MIYFNFVTEKSMKCIFCYPRLDEKVANACARQCTARVRWVGYVDKPDSIIYKLTKVWKVALPLHSEFGTNPNIFYVPPLAPPRLTPDGKIDTSKPRIPRGYLRYLFGPEVDSALATMEKELAKVRNGGRSELMDILKAKDWHGMFGEFTKDPALMERKPPKGAKFTRPMP